MDIRPLFVFSFTGFESLSRNPLNSASLFSPKQLVRHRAYVTVHLLQPPSFRTVLLLHRLRYVKLVAETLGAEVALVFATAASNASFTGFAVSSVVFFIVFFVFASYGTAPLRRAVF